MTTYITSNGVTTSNAYIASLSLNDDIIKRLSRAYDEDSIDSLPLSSALATAVRYLEDRISTMSGGGTTGDSVFTESYASKSFTPLVNDTSKGWSVTGWYKDTTSLYITNNVSVGYDRDNDVSVPPGRYTTTGQHLFKVTVAHISGSLIVTLNDVQLGIITTPGDHVFAFDVTNPRTDVLALQATDIVLGDMTQLTSGYVIGVKQELIDHTLYHIRSFFGGVTGTIVTREYLTDTLATLRSEFDGRYAPKAIVDDLYIPDQVRAAPLGISYDESLPRPPVLIRTSTLSHKSGGPYDPHSGWIYPSWISPDLSKALSDTASISTTSLPVGITYHLTEPRSIKSITVRVDHVEATSLIKAVRVTLGTTPYLINTYVNDTPGPTRYVTLTLPTPTVTDKLFFEIVSVTDTTPDKTVFFGFDVTYGDVDLSTIQIPSGIKVSTPNKYLTTSTDIPIDITSCVVGHAYTVAIKEHAGSVVGELLTIPPYYTESDSEYSHTLTYSPILSPYYGTPITTPALENPYHRTSIAHLVNSFTIEHTLPSVSARTISVYLREDTNLQSLSLSYTNSLGQQTIYAGEWKKVYTKDRVELRAYLPEDMSLVKYRLVTYALPNKTIPFLNVDVGLYQVYYNTKLRRWSDGAERKVLGTITRHASGSYTVSQAPLKGRCAIPVSGGSPLGLIATHRIHNPFGHTTISIVSVPSVVTIHVNPEWITILSGTSDTVILHIEQL